MGGNLGNVSVTTDDLRDKNVTPDVVIKEEDQPIVVIGFENCITHQVKRSGDLVIVNGKKKYTWKKAAV
jgi:hypothetical protein